MRSFGQCEVKMLFSVIIPAYNAAKCIRRSVNSILKQSISDFEIIIVNDGSTDDTISIIKSFTDSRIKIINQKNSGVSVARNNGIKNAKGSFICFLDADDEWYVNHLEVLNNAIQTYKNKLFFVTYSNTELLDGTIIREVEHDDLKDPFYIEDFLEYEYQQKMRKCFNTNCVCVNKKAFEKYGLFEVGVKISEDVDMWNRIMLFEGKVIIPIETVLRHRDYSQATRSMPLGAPFIFNKRISKYLLSDMLSEKKKNELRRLYNIMELTSARSFIIHGYKKEGVKTLKNIDKYYVSKKKYYESLIALLIPSWMMKKIYTYQGRKYYG